MDYTYSYSVGPYSLVGKAILKGRNPLEEMVHSADDSGYGG